MTQVLPIVLSIHKSIIDCFRLPKRIIEQQELAINFSALKANWFGNEDKNIYIQITLVSEQIFTQIFQQESDTPWMIEAKKLIAIQYQGIEIADPDNEQASQNNKTKLIIAMPNIVSERIETDLQFSQQCQLLLIQALNLLTEHYQVDSIISKHVEN